MQSDSEGVIWEGGAPIMSAGDCTRGRANGSFAAASARLGVREAGTGAHLEQSGGRRGVGRRAWGRRTGEEVSLD